MKTCDKVKRSFSAHSGNTGNIIRRITLKRLNLNKFLRRYTVLLVNCLFVINIGNCLPHFCACKKHLNTAVSKLQRIPVTRCNKTFVTVFSAYCGKSAENIVSLPAFFFNRFNSEIFKHFFKDRHLSTKLVRHTLTSCLIFIIHFMPKSRRMNVKCYGNCIRRANILKL